MKYRYKVVHVRVCVCVCVGCVSLKVASELLHATSGPVEAVESGLDQRRHDAAHVHLVAAAVLTVVLHPQPGAGMVEKD